MEILVDLIQARYPGISGHDGEMMYAIGRDAGGVWCVFSGITQHCTSTINAAEYIVCQIANDEGYSPDECAFYDLQTHRKYGYVHNEGTRHHGLPTGRFKLDHILMDIRVRGGIPSIGNLGWWIAGCPQEVYELFTPCIGSPIPEREVDTSRAYAEEEHYRQRGEKERAAGEYQVHTVSEALAGGYSMWTLHHNVLSVMHGALPDLIAHNRKHEFIVVDVGDYPNLLAQVQNDPTLGTRYWVWGRKCGKHIRPAHAELTIGGTSVRE